VTVSLDGYLLHEPLHCCTLCGSNLESFDSGQYPEHFHVRRSSLCLHPKRKTVTTAHYVSLRNVSGLTGFKFSRHLLISVITAFYQVMLCSMHSAVMPHYIICPPVCPSVTFRYRDHIGWNTSKITSWLISLRFMFRLTSTMGLVQREHPQN